jgi:hypothetical protein
MKPQKRFFRVLTQVKDGRRNARQGDMDNAAILLRRQKGRFP